MTITIGLKSPERGWPPFIEWLAAQGVDPNEIRAIVVDEETMTADIQVFNRRQGELYVDERGDIATKVLTIAIDLLPPRRNAG